MKKRPVGRPKQENAKDKQVSFRINEKDFETLERMSEKLGAGTAHTFVRDLAERVINSSGAVDSWNVDHGQTK